MLLRLITSSAIIGTLWALAIFIGNYWPERASAEQEASTSPVYEALTLVEEQCRKELFEVTAEAEIEWDEEDAKHHCRCFASMWLFADKGKDEDEILELARHTVRSKEIFRGLMLSEMIADQCYQTGQE